MRRAWRLRRRTKKIRGWGPTPVEPGNAGKDPVMWAARPLGAFRHEADGPAPARRLARECELAMKEKAGVSSRCMPLKQSGTEGKCVMCGKPATTDIYWGVAY